jgi:hypothetical protein
MDELRELASRGDHLPMLDGVELLRKEWGRDFERKINLAPQAVALLWPNPAEAERVRDWFDRSGMGEHPALIRAAGRLVERVHARRGRR